MRPRALMTTYEASTTTMSRTARSAYRAAMPKRGRMATAVTSSRMSTCTTPTSTGRVVPGTRWSIPNETCVSRAASGGPAYDWRGGVWSGIVPAREVPRRAALRLCKSVRRHVYLGGEDTPGEGDRRPVQDRIRDDRGEAGGRREEAARGERLLLSGTQARLEARSQG